MAGSDIARFTWFLRGLRLQRALALPFGPSAFTQADEPSSADYGDGLYKGSWSTGRRHKVSLKAFRSRRGTLGTRNECPRTTRPRTSNGATTDWLVAKST